MDSPQLPEDEPKVHGSIFFLLKKFVNHNSGEGSWENLLEQAGTQNKQYELTLSYPLSEIEKIVSAASGNTGLSNSEIKEAFGEFLVPDLFALYSSYLKPEWKTYEVLENTEAVMHGAVRRLNSTANPPVLAVARDGNDLIVDYHSKRKMASLAVGIIKGIVKYYKEEDKITVMNLTDTEAENVKIRIVFQPQ